MNITHAVEEEIHGDKLIAIFDRQKNLMFKYHDIEERSGLLQTGDCPVNIDDKRGQARIKDFSWRVTEELAEALDADMNNDYEHFCEELIDGLHFLTELTILAGKEPRDIIKGIGIPENNGDMLNSLFEAVGFGNSKNNLEYFVTQFIMDIGMMCNCLKNKPWKQTNMITDKENFSNKLSFTWLSYIRILSTCMTSEEVAMVYLKKSQVNMFRQRSGY